MSRLTVPEEMENMAANDENLGQEDPITDGNSKDEPRSRSRTTSRGRLRGRTLSRSPVATNRERPSVERSGSSFTPYLEDRLCRRLKFFFMGPYEKFIAKRRCPWKLLFQVVKIILVTIQLAQFGSDRSSFVQFTSSSTTSLKHLYLKNWENSYETMPYPPSSGAYAVYETESLVDYINYTLSQFQKTEKIAIAALYIVRKADRTFKPLVACLKHYLQGNFANDSYEIDTRLKEDCVTLWPRPNGTCQCNGFLECLRCENVTLDTDKLLTVTLKFTLRAIRLDVEQKNFPPQCYHVDTMIIFDDTNKDGQMKIKLDANFTEYTCHGKFSNGASEKTKEILVVFLDGLVILFTVMSLLLCTRSLLRAEKLRRVTAKFFRKRYGKNLSLSDHLEFLNLWYLTIVINDILTVIGTSVKIQIETRTIKSSSTNFDICGVMLGTGTLLAWMGVLRYIGFFQQFNILILTLKKAFPNMLRFLACCVMLYFGFVICGWVVLGPYHIKFKDLSSASDCLFSLINGDDMFVTFSATVTTNTMVWYYSKFYLYIFISLFIYGVLNLFIAVILDTYETIKDYYEHGFPKSELFEFIDQCTDPAHSPHYRVEDNSCNPVSVLCCCCRSDNPDEPNEYTTLINH